MARLLLNLCFAPILDISKIIFGLLPELSALLAVESIQNRNGCTLLAIDCFYSVAKEFEEDGHLLFVSNYQVYVSVGEHQCDAVP